MKWILRIIIIVLVLIALIFATGYILPAHTTHTRTIKLKQPPDKVFAVLDDIPNMPKWNRNMEKVVMLTPIDGKERSRQTFKGGMDMEITTTESSPPNHLVRVLGDTEGPFSGSWTYGITATPDGGSQVALTEQSEIPNPFFRVMIKLFGPTKYMDGHLEDLAKQFGETVTVR
jgi:uncharacterized protein YndB with AHSA1/START domain